MKFGSNGYGCAQAQHVQTLAFYNQLAILSAWFCVG